MIILTFYAYCAMFGTQQVCSMYKRVLYFKNLLSLKIFLTKFPKRYYFFSKIDSSYTYFGYDNMEK